MPILSGWDETAPHGTDLASTIDDFTRALKVSIRERMQVEHHWGESTAVDGTHKQISIGTPAPGTSSLAIGPSARNGSEAQPHIVETATWNTTGLVTWLKLVLTNTASAVGSALIDLVVNGISVFKVDRDGVIVKGGFPIGSIIAYAAPTGLLGWNPCDGSEQLRTGPMAKLFAVIGTTWGPGDGVTTFNVPDLRGRAPIGQSYGGGGIGPNRTVGELVGSDIANLTTDQMPAHAHTLTDPGHTHLLDLVRTATSASGGAGLNVDVYGPPDGQYVHPAPTGITMGSVGGGQPHNNMQPSAVVTYMIRFE